MADEVDARRVSVLTPLGRIGEVAATDEVDLRAGAGAADVGVDEDSRDDLLTGGLLRPLGVEGLDAAAPGDLPATIAAAAPMPRVGVIDGVDDLLDVVAIVSGGKYDDDAEYVCRAVVGVAVIVLLPRALPVGFVLILVSGIARAREATVASAGKRARAAAAVHHLTRPPRGVPPPRRPAAPVSVASTRGVLCTRLLANHATSNFVTVWLNGILPQLKAIADVHRCGVRGTLGGALHTAQPNRTSEDDGAGGIPGCGWASLARRQGHPRCHSLSRGESGGGLLSRPG